MQHTPTLLSTLLPYIVVFAIVAVRMRRMAGLRPMRLQYLWIRPAIVAALAAALIYSAPPHGLGQGLILLAACAVGALLGWHQAKLMAISIDAQSGTLQVKASVWAMVLFLGILLLRMGLRSWLTGATSPAHAYVGVVTDGLMLFIVGLLGARATEMFIRGRALLAAQAQSSRPG